MFYFNTLNLNQISGGNQVKQGDFGSTFTNNLADEKGRELDVFDQKTAYVNLVLDNNIVFTTTVIVDGSTVTFNIDKAIPIGLYFLEIKIDSYILPSDRQTIILVTAGAVAYDLKELVPNYDTNMTITGILSDLSQKGIDISDLNRRIGNAAEKDQTNSLQSQLNALVLGAVGDGNNAEVVQSKVDSFGSTFDTLKEHFDNVELMIKSNKTEIKRSDWFLAVYNAGTGTATPYGLAETLVTPILSFGSLSSLNFNVISGYRVSVGTYSDNSGTFISNQGWYTGQFNFSLKSDKFYRLVIGKVSGGKAQLNFSDFVTITSTFENEVTDMRKNIFGGAFETANDRVNALEDIIATAKLEIKYPDWFLAVYNGGTGTATPYALAQTIATNVKEVGKIRAFNIKPKQGYRSYVAFYDSDGKTLIGNSGWITTEKIIDVEPYTHVRFLIGKVDGSVATLDFKNNVEISIDFKSVFSGSTKNYVTVGKSGSDFTSVGEAFAFARLNDLEVIIKPGIYDLVQEGISGGGYILPKKVVGYGATLTCHLPSEKWELSPLNTSYLYDKHEVYGLKVECSNCRYNIHDEMGAKTTGFYQNVFKDLHLIHYSNSSKTLVAPNNIGGGVGNHGYIEIDNCVFEQKGGYARNIDYHSSFTGNQTNKVTLKVTNSYFDHVLTVTSQGTSTNFMNVAYVNNCKFGASVPSVVKTNFQLISWGNEFELTAEA